MIAVQHIRVKVDPVQPTNGARDRVHSHTRKHLHVTQTRKNSIGEHWLKVELSDNAVRERQPDHEAADGLGLCDSCQVAHGQRLPKPIDRDEFFAACARRQSSNGSNWRSSAHSRTSLPAVRGNEPASTAPPSIVTCGA